MSWDEAYDEIRERLVRSWLREGDRGRAPRHSFDDGRVEIGPGLQPRDEGGPEPYRKESRCEEVRPDPTTQTPQLGWVAAR